jgi:cysteine desulfurase / selenocysteine lyase
MNINQIRSDFPQLSREVVGRPIVYFDNAATSLKPTSVLAAMDGYNRTYCANIHRGKHLLSEEASAAYEASRETLAKFINARSVETIFVRGATEGIGMIAAGLNLRPDDNVVGTVLEHHSNILPWRNYCAYRGTPLSPDGLPDLEAAEALIDERTRLITITMCSNVTGALVDVKPWGEIAHRHGLPLLVDAAQCGGHTRIDVNAMDCDFMVLSGHKMFGPTGAGVLYGKQERLESLRPPTLGGGTVNRVYADYSFDIRDLPWRLEAGTPDIAAVIGLAAAVEYIEKLGIENLEARTHELSDALATRLANVPGIRLLSPAAGIGRTSLVSIAIENEAVSPDYVTRLLSDTHGIMTRGGFHCAHPLHEYLNAGAGSLRASLHVYNTEEEIEYFCRALAGVVELVAVGGRVGI